MKRLLKYIISVLVFAGAAILIFFASKVDAKTDPIRKYNNTNYVSTSGEITEDGVITVHMRYEGIRDSAYKAEIRVYIEKRILGLFWTKAALGGTGDQWNTTVEDVRYDGSYSFKLPSKGTYRVHVSYTIYGSGGAADVIEEQFTVSYKSTDSNETESLSAPSASESPASDETQETAVEAPAVLTFSTNDIRQIWRESITEDAWEKDPEVYSRVLWSAYPGKTKVRTTDRLPDVLSGTDEKEANKLTGRNYDISSLGISMEIPNGFYLYHVKGQYKDSDGNPVELEFVDEYILTMMDVDEDRLLSDMADYDNRHHTSDAPYYRGPGYVVYSFKVMRAEYLPIESLYVSTLPITGEYRIKGDYLCIPGRCEWWAETDQGEKNWLCFHDQEAITPGYSGNFRDAYRIPDKDWPVDGWQEMISRATAPNGLVYTGNADYPNPEQMNLFMWGILPLFRNGTAERGLPLTNSTFGYEYIENADTSVVSGDWWETYQNALKQLDEGGDRFAYPDIRIRFERRSGSKLEGAFGAHEKDMESGWYMDPAADRGLRAFVYANLSAYRDTRLEDVLILLKDTDVGRLFYAFVSDRDSEAARNSETGLILTPVDRGVDYLSCCDLDFAREYSVKYLQTKQ